MVGKHFKTNRFISDRVQAECNHVFVPPIKTACTSERFRMIAEGWVTGSSAAGVDFCYCTVHMSRPSCGHLTEEDDWRAIILRLKCARN